MYTISRLFELVSKAVKENELYSGTWFINYSGHVNQIDMDYFPTGWEQGKDKHNESCRVYLNSEDSIAEAYFFIKNRLRG